MRAAAPRDATQRLEVASRREGTALEVPIANTPPFNSPHDIVSAPGIMTIVSAQDERWTTGRSASACVSFDVAQPASWVVRR